VTPSESNQYEVIAVSPAQSVSDAVTSTDNNYQSLQLRQIQDDSAGFYSQLKQ